MLCKQSPRRWYLMVASSVRRCVNKIKHYGGEPYGLGTSMADHRFDNVTHRLMTIQVFTLSLEQTMILSYKIG